MIHIRYNYMSALFMSLLLALPNMVLAETLTIQQCREMALKNNKDRKSASLQTKAALYNKKAVKAQFFPDLSLSGIGLYGTSQECLGIDLTGMKQGMSSAIANGVASGALLPEQALYLGQVGTMLPNKLDVLDYKLGFVYSGGVMLKQPLFMGGKIMAAYRASDLAVSLYQESERLSEAQVIESADEAYAKVINATELARVALRYKELLQELDSNVQSAIKHGMRMENDRLKVQVRLNEVELQLRRAQNGIRLAKMNLCHVTGQPLNTDVEVSSDYPVVDDAMELQTIGVSARPEVAMLDYQTQIAQQKVKIARSEQLPQLALLAKYGYTHGVEVNGRYLLDGWNFAGGVTLNVPLYHFGERSNKVKAAKTQLEQAQLERQNKEELMMLELAQAANNLDEARLEITLSETSLIQAESNMNVVGKQYEAGLEPLSEYLEAQALWQKAYEAKVNAYFQLFLASTHYLKAAGTL